MRVGSSYNESEGDNIINDNSTPLFQNARPNGLAVKVAIVTDSIAQVPADLVRQLDIHPVPFTVVVEGTIYTDLVDLNLNYLYQHMRIEKDLRPVTSAPSVGVFYET